MTAIATGDVLGREWFDLLDQRRFTVDHECWTAQVFGVHVAGAEAWIQLEFEEDRRRSAEAGFNSHLVKPIEPAALQALLAGLAPA